MCHLAEVGSYMVALSKRLRKIGFIVYSMFGNLCFKIKVEIIKLIYIYNYNKKVLNVKECYFTNL